MSNINIIPNMSAADQVEAIGKQYQLKLWSEIERIGLTSCPYADSTNAICLDDGKVEAFRKALGITERGAPVHAELPTIRRDASPIERVWVFTGLETDARNFIMKQIAIGLSVDKPELWVCSTVPNQVTPENTIGYYADGMFAPLGFSDEESQALLDNLLAKLDSSIVDNRYFLISIAKMDFLHPLIRMRIGSVFHCSPGSSHLTAWVVFVNTITNQSRRYLMPVSKETVDEQSRLSSGNKSGDDNLDRPESEQLPVESSPLNQDEENNILPSGSECDRVKLPRHLGGKRFGRSSSGSDSELAADEGLTVDETRID